MLPAPKTAPPSRPQVARRLPGRFRWPEMARLSRTCALALVGADCCNRHIGMVALIRRPDLPGSPRPLPLAGVRQAQPDGVRTMRAENHAQLQSLQSWFDAKHA